MLSTLTEASDSLFEKLKKYAESDAYPFHMPGHKRSFMMPGGCADIDITEIDGFDDLHHAQEILKNCMDNMAEAVGAKKSYFLVNGSTCGILSAIYAVCRDGDRIAVARNCHKSVAHGIILRHLNPVYIYPQYVDELGINSGITERDVENICNKTPDLRAIVITSPTYEGVVSDISGISRVIHEHGGILIVDEAHGAHLSYGDEAQLAKSAVNEGADIVIQSLHKTLPAYTQSAALHICSSRVSAAKVERALRIFETSSPSYVMLAAMDACVRYMNKDGRKRLAGLCKRLDMFYNKSESWKNLIFLRDDSIKISGIQDKTRIVFGVRDRNGRACLGGWLHRQLADKYKLQPEMSTPGYVVLIAAVGDTEEGFTRLEEALENINEKLEQIKTMYNPEDKRSLESDECNVPDDYTGKIIADARAEAVVLPWEAEAAEAVSVPLSQAVGKISAEMVYIYPPGSPIVMPGERISRSIADILNYYRECGFGLVGLEDKEGETIKTLDLS